MKQEIYSDADADVKEALLTAKQVDDFLPPPGKLTRATRAGHPRRLNLQVDNTLLEANNADHDDFAPLRAPETFSTRTGDLVY